MPSLMCTDYHCYYIADSAVELQEHVTHQHLKALQPDELVSIRPNTPAPEKSSVLTQLRTGHCSLNSSLNRFNLQLTALSDCGKEGTVVHFLKDCKLCEDLHSCIELRTSVTAFSDLFFKRAVPCLEDCKTINGFQKISNFRMWN